MVATPETRATQAAALVALRASTPASFTTQSLVLTAINFPSPFEYSSQVAGLVVAQPSIPLQTTQAILLVAIKIGAESKIMRAWTFTMDGHDFYVLHGGADFTLIYDRTTQQWATWQTPGWDTWRAGMGMNWDNEIVGGDLYDGTIWNIDPTVATDEDDPDVFVPIQSTIIGFIGWRGRDPLPCFGVSLVGSQGEPADGTAYVNLKISDDMSASFFDCGNIETPVTGKYDYDISWYSLGQIQAPGRTFMIIDGGSLARIDSLTLLDEQGAQNGGS